MQDLLKGAAAGTLATAPMTATIAALRWMFPLRDRHDAPPRKVTRFFARIPGLWQRADHEQRKAITALAHFGYGAATGALYAPLVARLRPPAVLGGVGYGLLIWFGSYQTWVPWLHIMRPASDSPPARNVVMAVAHVVWGATLGLLLDRWLRPAARPAAPRTAWQDQAVGFSSR